MRGLSFVAENVKSESHVKGAVIFLKMVIITYNKNRSLGAQNNATISLAVLSNTSLQTAALVIETIKNETIANKIEAAVFLEKIFKTIGKRIDFVMP